MDKHWIADIFMKILFGVCTVLLSIAVNSLDSMKTEIKSLSTNVFDLSSQSKVIMITINNMEKRIDRLEIENEKVKEKLTTKQ